MGSLSRVYRFLQRLTLHEQHGGQAATVRCIDNAFLGCKDAFSATTTAHRPCDLDAWVALIRLVASMFVMLLCAIANDFKAAYRQVTADPAQARLFVVAMWCCATSSIVYGAVASQLFCLGVLH